MNRAITGTTRLACLLGHPVGHSKSPFIHNNAFSRLGMNCVYLNFEVDENALADAVQAMRTLNVIGFNVTMPNKKAVMPYLDEISKEAALIGAVNTVTHEGGRLIGYNTDGMGFVKVLEENGVSFKGEKLVICGAGGAGRAIAVQLALSGAGQLSVFDIQKGAAEALAQTINENIPGCSAHAFASEEAALARETAGAKVFIHCTGLGMHPYEGQSVIQDVACFHPGVVVADLIYEPSPTKLLAMAASRGAKTIDGLDMVYNQGVYAFKLWTGCTHAFEEIKAMMKGV